MQTYDKDQWEEVRQKGKMPFVLRHALLGRGLPLGVITAIAISVYRGSAFPDLLQTLDFYGLVVFCVAVFTLSGSIAANANWSVHERRHAAGGE